MAESDPKPSDSAEKKLNFMPQWARSGGGFGPARSPAPVAAPSTGATSLSQSTLGSLDSKGRSGPTLAQSGGRRSLAASSGAGGGGGGKQRQPAPTDQAQRRPSGNSPPPSGASASSSRSATLGRSSSANTPSSARDSASSRFGLPHEGRGSRYGSREYSVDEDLGPGLERKASLQSRGLYDRASTAPMPKERPLERFAFVGDNASAPVESAKVLRYSVQEMLSFADNAGSTFPPIHPDVPEDLISQEPVVPALKSELNTDQIFKEWFEQLSKDRERRSNRRSTSDRQQGDDDGYSGRRAPPGWRDANMPSSGGHGDGVERDRFGNMLRGSERGGSGGGGGGWDRSRRGVSTPGADKWERGQKPNGREYNKSDGDTFGDISGVEGGVGGTLALESMAAAAEKFRLEMEAERQKQMGDANKDTSEVPADLTGLLGSSGNDILDEPLEAGLDQPPAEEPVPVSESIDYDGGDYNNQGASKADAAAPSTGDDPMAWNFEGVSGGSNPWNMGPSKVVETVAGNGVQQQPQQPPQQQQQQHARQEGTPAANDPWNSMGGAQQQQQQQQQQPKPFPQQQQQQHVNMAPPQQFRQGSVGQASAVVPPPQQQPHPQPPQQYVIIQCEWFYKDPQGSIQGPFQSKDMREWFQHGYFKGYLPIRRGRNGPFVPLASMFTDAATAFTEPSPLMQPPLQRGPSNGPPHAPQDQQQYQMMMMQAQARQQQQQDPRLMQPPVPQQQQQQQQHMQQQQQAQARYSSSPLQPPQNAWGQGQPQLMAPPAQQQPQQQQQANAQTQQQQEAAFALQQQQQQHQQMLRMRQEQEFQRQQQEKAAAAAQAAKMQQEAEAQAAAAAAAAQQQKLAEMQRQEAEKKALEQQQQQQQQQREAAAKMEQQRQQQQQAAAAAAAAKEAAEEQQRLAESKKVPPAPELPAWGGGVKPARKLTLKEIQEQEEADRKRQIQTTGTAPSSGMSMAARVAAAAGIAMAPGAAAPAPAGAPAAPATAASATSASDGAAWGSSGAPAPSEAPEGDEAAGEGKNLVDMSVDLKQMLGVGAPAAAAAPSGGSAWGSATSKPKTLVEIQEEEARQRQQAKQQGGDGTFWGYTEGQGGQAPAAAPASGWAAKVGGGAGVVSGQQQPERVVRQAAAPQQQQQYQATQKQQREQTHVAASASRGGGNNNFGKTMSPSFREWAGQEVSKMGADVALAEFCYSLESAAEIREYMRDYLGSTPQVSAFATEFIRRKSDNQRGGHSSKSHANNNGFSEVTRKKKGGR